MVGVKIDRDSPLEARARNAEILQAGLDKVVEHFFFAAFGIYKVRVRFYIFLKLLLVF